MVFRRKNWFDEFFDEFEDIEEELERFFREFTKRKEEFAGKPLYYGFSVRIGKEGIPEIRTFGNIKPGHVLHGIEEEIGEVREPFCDVIYDDRNNEVILTLEMPGLEKSDIKINATERSIEVSGERGDRKYHTRVPLEYEIEPKTAKAKYNNGVLEIKAKVRGEIKKGGHEVKVE